jgi:hypothetical protein
MPDRTNLGGWSSSALRRLFDEHRSDYSILNRLNEVLKQRNNDSDNDLHVDVVMALRAAQKHVNERAAAHHQDVLGKILARHGQIVDGRPLFQYRVTEAEYHQLREYLGGLHQSRLLMPQPRTAAMFVLFASEWFRREFDGGMQRWDDLAPEILAHLPYPAKRQLAIDGLEWWKRKVRVLGGDREYLLTLVLEGGFPTRVLESRETGWLSSHLRRVISRVVTLQAGDQDEAFQISEAAEDGIRATFRNRDFHLLCAELALAIAKLKREAESDAPAMVSPSAYLDGIRPAWREELPIALEGDGAQRLVDDLMNTKVVHFGSDIGARAKRLLIRSDEGWTTGVRIGADGEIDLPKPLTDSRERMSVHPARTLCDFIGSELAVIDPPGDEGRWLSRPRRQAREVIIGFPFERPVEVELRYENRSRGITMWPGGEPRRGEVLIFSDDRPDQPGEFTLPFELSFVGSGSYSSRQKTLYVWSLPEFTVSNASDNSPISPIWRGHHLLFCVQAPVHIRAGNTNDIYRVEPGANGESSQSIELFGSRFSGAEHLNPAIDIYAGPPQIQTRAGTKTDGPRMGELFWRELGTRVDNDIRSKGLPTGTLDIIWRDPLSRTIRDKVRVSVLPPESSLRVRPQGPLTVEYALENASGWSVAATPGQHTTAVNQSGALLLGYSSRPNRIAHVKLVPRNGLPVEVTARFPIFGGGFSKPDGSLFRPRERVLLESLRGAWAFTEGRTLLTLELRARGSLVASQAIAINDERSLNGTCLDIERMLSATGDLDAEVWLTLDSDERRIVVAHYMNPLSIREGKIGLRGAVGDEVTIEWRSVCDPTPAGYRCLQTKSFHAGDTEVFVEVPEDLCGPGIVYARSGAAIVGRPTILVGSQYVDASTFCLLQKATMLASEGERRRGIHQVFELISSAATNVDPDLYFLHDMLSVLNGISPVALDAFRYLPEHLPVAAALMASARNDQERERVWALERELPLLWALVPVRVWAIAFFAQVERQKRLLLEAGIDQALAQNWASKLSPAIDHIVSLDDNLRTPLTLAGLYTPEGLPNRQLDEIAQDCIRRNQISSTSISEKSCFREEPQLACQFPSSFFRYSQEHLESLDAPCAAALAAAERFKPTPAQFRRIRAGLADDPFYFAEAYSVRLREIARS